MENCAMLDESWLEESYQLVNGTPLEFNTDADEGNFVFEEFFSNNEGNIIVDNATAVLSNLRCASLDGKEPPSPGSPECVPVSKQDTDLLGLLSEGEELGATINPNDAMDILLEHLTGVSEAPPLSPTDSLISSITDAPLSPSDSVMSSVTGSGSSYISDDDLISISTPELNSRLKALPKDTIAMIKKRRRTLKNRGYAFNCRAKRTHTKQNLQEENACLHKEVEKLKKELNDTKRQLTFYKRECDRMALQKED